METNTAVDRYTAWVSGGRDSVAAFLRALNHVGDREKFRIVHIYTYEGFKPLLDVETIENEIREKFGMTQREYVQYIGETLGIEVVVIKPRTGCYWENFFRYGYPSIVFRRWCYRCLKYEPSVAYVKREIAEFGAPAVWVSGVRHFESPYRRRHVSEDEWAEAEYNGIKVKVWRSVAFFTESNLMFFLKKVMAKYGLKPYSLWGMGFSMECPCFAGSGLTHVIRIREHLPKSAKALGEAFQNAEAQLSEDLPKAPFQFAQRGIKSLSAFLLGQIDVQVKRGEPTKLCTRCML